MARHTCRVRKSPATDHLLLQIGGLLAKTTRAVRG
jgi:hypothetical protein